MRNKIACILIVCFLGLSISPVSTSANESVLNNENFESYYSKEENQPNYGERFTAGIIISFANWMLHVLGVQDPVLLVFGKNPRDNNDPFLTGGMEGDIPRDQLILGVFPEEYFKGMAFFYDKIEEMLPLPLVLFMMIMGLIMMFQGGSQEGRSKVKDYALAFVVAIVSLRFGYYLWSLTFGVNYFLVDFIWDSLKEYGIKVGFFLDMIWGNGAEGYTSFANSVQSLGVAVIVFFAAIMTAVLNYQYGLRMIILSVLILTFPIVTTLSIFPKFRHSLQIWWQEFVAHVFFQTAHAFVLGLFFIALSGMKNGGLSFWVVVAYFFGLPTVVALFRQMLGLESRQNVMGTLGAMMGVQALTNMARMLKSNHEKSDANGSQEKDNGPDSTSRTTSGSSSSHAPLVKTLNTGKRELGSRWVTGAVRNTGATLGATVGAIVSGMATGNPMFGSVVGAGMGGSAANWTRRIGGSAINFVKDYKNWKEDDDTNSPFLGSTDSGSMHMGSGSPVQTTSSTSPSYASTSPSNGVMKFLESRYISGQGGFLTNAAVSSGWGLQRLLYTASGGKWGGSAPVRTDFIKSQQHIVKQANQGMNQLAPELSLAQEKLTEMQSRYGPGSAYHNFHRDPQTGKFLKPEPLVKAEEHYHQLQAQYSQYKTQAMEATLNLTNHQRMMESIHSLQNQGDFSNGRGRL